MANIFQWSSDEADYNWVDSNVKASACLFCRGILCSPIPRDHEKLIEIDNKKELDLNSKSASPKHETSCGQEQAAFRDLVKVSPTIISPK